MKILAINGSPRKKGNTARALATVGEVLKAEGIDFEIVQVGSMDLRGCIACNGCAVKKNDTCVAFKDGFNEIVQEIKSADGIILGSPVYFSGVAGGMKSFLDRMFTINTVNDSFLRHKVGACVAVVRRSGGISTLDELYRYVAYSEMIIPTSNYWNVIHGMNPGEVDYDEEGRQILEVLGANMAWLTKVIAGTDVPRPTLAKKVMTNFIR